MESLERELIRQSLKILPTLSDDELRARLGRRGRGVVARPPRAWCLAVRASDRRIHAGCAAIVPVREADPVDGEPRGMVVAERVTLDTELLKRLCRPVEIEPPGIPQHELAERLGVHPNMLRWGRMRGVFRTHHVRGLEGRRGPATPMLYTDRVLDPGALGLVAADPLWGWTGEYLVNRLSGEVRQTVERVAVWRSAAARRVEDEDGVPVTRRVPRLAPPGPDNVWYKWRGEEYLGDGVRRRKRTYRPKPSRARGSVQFNGWRWVCPGCGRRVKMVYYPAPPVELPVWELVERRLGGGAVEGVAGLPAALPCFACHACHGVRSFARVGADQWNCLVAVMTGGLLYGHEVPRPADYETRAKARPRRAGRQLMRRPSRRREEVAARWVAGMEAREIARELGICVQAVDPHLAELCRQHRVANRRELARVLGRRAPLFSERVLGLWRKGLSVSEMARELGESVRRVGATVRHLREEGEGVGEVRMTKPELRIKSE